MDEYKDDQKSEKNRACFYGLVVGLMLTIIIGFIVFPVINNPRVGKIIETGESSNDETVRGRKRFLESIFSGIIKKPPTKCRHDSDCGPYGICYVNAGMNDERWCKCVGEYVQVKQKVYKALQY